ncbi:MAG: hypothetical protein FJZ92_13115 [Chloroflexi bacterium]|nr:hypothetical protein [Chloroflexota bacterium]
MSVKSRYGRRVSRRNVLRGMAAGALGLAGAALIGCGGEDEVKATPTTAPARSTPAVKATAAPTAPPTPTPKARATRGQIFVFSNSSPHISVIDTVSQKVTKTADVPEFTSWAWNDDNNHAEGNVLWLGMRNPTTSDAFVVTLDMEKVEVTKRIPIGKENLTLYIGKAAKDGTLHVGKQGAQQVAVIDTKAGTLKDTWSPPVNGDVVCDADVSTDARGVERFVYPTRRGDTIVTLDPKTGTVLKEVPTPKGSTPLMLSTGPDGRIWVQDSGSNTNSVYDPIELKELARFPSGTGPVVNSFSPDGKLTYVGHSADTIVQVIDTATYREVKRITAGTNPQKLAVHPDGSKIYAILTRDGAVAVIDTKSWEVAERVSLGTNPNGIYLRGLA